MPEGFLTFLFFKYTRCEGAEIAEFFVRAFTWWRRKPQVKPCKKFVAIAVREVPCIFKSVRFPRKKNRRQIVLPARARAFGTPGRPQAGYN